MNNKEVISVQIHAHRAPGICSNLNVVSEHIGITCSLNILGSGCPCRSPDSPRRNMIKATYEI